MNDDYKKPRELHCQICGVDHVPWFAPNEIWNPVMRNEDGSDRYPFVCLNCFAAEAVKAGIDPAAWLLTTETQHEESKAEAGHRAPSADLVAAAREVSSLEGRSIAQITGWLAKPRDTRRYIKVGCDPLLRLAAALQNTPEPANPCSCESGFDELTDGTRVCADCRTEWAEPNESEAVKLLRELVAAITPLTESEEVMIPGNQAAGFFVVLNVLTAAEAFLSNTPEVDDDAE